MSFGKGCCSPFAGTALGAACVFHAGRFERRSAVHPDRLCGGGHGPAVLYAPSFAAGAMIYVVVEELIPEMSVGTHSNTGTVLFAAGFTLMMTLDVALGGG